MSNDIKAVLTAAGVPDLSTLAAAQDRVQSVGELLDTPSGPSTHDVLARQAQPLSRDLQFSADPATGQMVVHILSASGEVVRQIPSIEAQELARVVGRLQGAFLTDKA
jgi:uncharacterized FlaG/YvyC family protein